MIRGIRMGAPATVGAYAVTTMVADTYGERRRWVDWIGGIAGACLVLDNEGTMIRQTLYFADFSDALVFHLRWGSDDITKIGRDVRWTDIKKNGQTYSPLVYVSGYNIRSL